MEATITPKLEISFVLRDNKGNIKEQGTEITELITKDEATENGNTNE